MKIYILTLIFLLSIQNSFCSQLYHNPNDGSIDIYDDEEFDSTEEPEDNVYFFYPNQDNELLPLFSLYSNEEGRRFKMSDDGIFKMRIENWCHTIISRLFYTIKTPIIDLSKDNLLRYSKYHNKYVSAKCEHDPNYFRNWKFFTKMPHCGDLASCSAQLEIYRKNEDLVQLLHASYNVQKLVYSNDEYFRDVPEPVEFRSEVMPLVKKFLLTSFSYNSLQEYDNLVRKIFFNGVISYSTIITKHILMLLLLSHYLANVKLKIRLHIITLVTILIDGIRRNPLSILPLFIITMGIYSEDPSSKIYFCYKLFSVCRTIHASFFLGMLCYKHSKLKKIINKCKIPCILKTQGHTILL
jgi:hypothetical protein